MNLRKVEVKLSHHGTRKDENGKIRYVPAEYGKGYFHCWDPYKDEEDSFVSAIVELEDGTLRKFDTNDVKFLDKPE